LTLQQGRILTRKKGDEARTAQKGPGAAEVGSGFWVYSIPGSDRVKVARPEKVIEPVLQSEKVPERSSSINLASSRRD